MFFLFCSRYCPSFQVLSNFIMFTATSKYRPANYLFKKKIFFLCECMRNFMLELITKQKSLLHLLTWYMQITFHGREIMGFFFNDSKCMNTKSSYSVHVPWKLIEAEVFVITVHSCYNKLGYSEISLQGNWLGPEHLVITLQEWTV